MLSTVLVPLDGSGFAEAALPIAKRLVQRAGGRLYLATAGHTAVALPGRGEMSTRLWFFEEPDRREDEAYLARAAEELGTVGEGPVRVSVVDGPAGEAICEEAGRIGADLIVMATHGRNTMERAWLGSVADQVVRHASRPVLLVKPHRLGGQPADLPIRNILVPLDPSDYSEAILEPVLTVARLLGARLTLLTVVSPQFGIAEPELPPPAPQHPAIVARRSDEAHARLDRIAMLYRAVGILVRTRVTVAGTPAAGILEVLGEERFDMVALATHGAVGLRRILAGSVADKVIRGGSKPVLVYHPSTP